MEIIQLKLKKLNLSVYIHYILILVFFIFIFKSNLLQSIDLNAPTLILFIFQNMFDKDFQFDVANEAN